jgi:hypothetical protein
MRKPLRPNALAEVRNRLRIAKEILKAHGLSLRHGEAQPGIDSPTAWAMWARLESPRLRLESPRPGLVVFRL